MMGDIIAQHRKQNNLTQEELGRMLGVTNQSVSKWESGASLPDIMLLPQISDALHISLDTLYGKDESQPVRVKADEFPSYCYDRLIQDFFEQSGARIGIDETYKNDANAYFKALDQGSLLGCISDTSGVVLVSKDIAFVDKDYKKAGLEDYLKSRTVASVLQTISDEKCARCLLISIKRHFRKRIQA